MQKAGQREGRAVDPLQQHHMRAGRAMQMDFGRGIAAGFGLSQHIKRGIAQGRERNIIRLIIAGQDIAELQCPGKTGRMPLARGGQRGWISGGQYAPGLGQGRQISKRSLIGGQPFSDPPGDVLRAYLPL